MPIEVFIGVDVCKPRLDLMILPTGEVLEFTVITTTPNEVVAELHDHMPVIVKPRDYENWLVSDPDFEDLRAVLRKYPAVKMRTVSRHRKARAGVGKSGRLHGGDSWLGIQTRHR